MQAEVGVDDSYKLFGREQSVDLQWRWAGRGGSYVFTPSYH